MSNPNEKPKGESQAAASPAPEKKSRKDNVSALPGMCICDGCKEKSQKAGFCMEHFDWFKEGLVTKEGRRPTDFDKKHFDYQRRRQKKVA